MRTTVSYNSVTIKDVVTESIVGQAIKESTGVDQLGVEVTVSLTGVVHAAINDQIGYKVVEPSAASAGQFGPGLSALLAKLTKDRRRFTMNIGTGTLFDIVPGAKEPGFPADPAITGRLMDIDNGPIPKVDILKIISGVSATIRFTIRFVVTNCGGAGNLNANGLLFFRFWIAENINCLTWLTTRRYQGMIRVAHKNISPHQLARTVTVPPLEDGFVRRIVNWDESPNGLELAFTIEDQETVAAPPYSRFDGFGATSWQGRLTHSTDTLGATSIIQADVTLTGPKSTSILELADLALKVISQKIQYAKLVKGQQAYFLDFSITEEFADNVVGCSAKIRHTGNQADFIGLFHLGNSPVIGQPMGDLGIGYDSNVAFQPGPSAGIGGLYLSALQTACAPNKFPTTTAVKSKYKRQRQRGQSQSENGDSPGYPTDLSSSQQEAMYFDYRLESEYRFNTGRIALPTGAPRGASGSSENSQTQDTLAIVNLHRPTAIREVRIASARLNFPPELPDISQPFEDRAGIRNVPIGVPHLSPVAPQLSADGRNLLYEISLEACYAMARPPTTSERIAIGCVPYRKADQNDASRSLPGEIFLPPGSILS